MIEIMLSHAEFVCLLDAIQAKALIGIPGEALFPADPVQHQALIKQGNEQLLQRGLLMVQSDGERIFDVMLIAMVTALAQPDLAAIAMRRVRQANPQLFLLFQSDSFTVEHTYTNVGEHRLALLEAPSALVQRLHAVIALPEGEAPVTRLELPQDDFFTVKRLVASGQAQAGCELLHRAGFTEQITSDLVQAIEHPELSGSVALMRVRGNNLIDARNVGVECGESTAWVIEQSVPGEPVLRIETGNADRLRQILERDVAQLMTSA